MTSTVNMKKRMAISSAFLVIFVVVGIVTLPARLIVHWFPIEGMDLAKAEVSGPWWDARIDHASLTGYRLDTIHLIWSPDVASLDFSNWQLQWVAPVSSGSASATWPLEGNRLTLNDVEMNINFAQMTLPQFASLGISKIYGKLFVSVPDIDLDLANASTDASWQAYLNDLHIQEPIIWSLDSVALHMKDISGHLQRHHVLGKGGGSLAFARDEASNEMTAYMTIGFDQPPMYLSGQLTLQRTEFASNVNIQLSPNTPNIVRQLVPLVAQELGENDYSVVRKWQL